MTTYCCTDCGCEASALRRELVENMGWIVLADESADIPIAAVCGPCRRRLREACIADGRFSGRPHESRTASVPDQIRRAMILHERHAVLLAS